MATAKKLPSGSWRCQVFMGKDANPKYVSVTCATKKEAELEALKLQLDKNRKSVPSKNTLSEAIDRYIELKEPVLSAATISGYKKIQRNQLQKLMGLKIGEITQNDVQLAVNADAKKYSPKSVRNAHGLLSTVMAEYVPELALKTNLPSKEKYIPSIPNHEEVKAILVAIKGKEIELPVLLALWLGLRMSEIRGIKYNDIKGTSLNIRRAIVDADGIAVEKNTKTYSSTRTIEMPDKIALLIEKSNDGASEYVVKLSAQAIYKRFVRICEKNGLPHFRFHDLRHANASIMLALGVPDKYAMERMGHATNNMLKTVYQHTLSSEKDAISKTVNRYFSEMLTDDE